MTSTFELIAQTTPTPSAPSGPSPTASFLPIAIMLAVVVYMMLSMRSQRKREQKDRDAMHERLAKNDRVLTVGGVIGTVMSVKEDEVVLKVDETTNTKMTFLKTSIQRILSEPSSG